MIVRRLVENLKQQHWTGVFIELAIVVLGVFIGLQVDNWSQARGDRAAEIGYLGGLKEDVDYSTRTLLGLIRAMEEQQAARARLYAFATDPASTLEPAQRDRLVLVGLFEFPELHVSQVTFETLKSSGRLAAIRSPELVSELQSLSGDVAAALGVQANELQATYQFTDPVLVGNFDMAGVFRQSDQNGTRSISWLTSAPDTAPTPAIMKKQEFANILLYRSFFTDLRLASVRDMLEQHQKITKLIKARQAELGVEP